MTQPESSHAFGDIPPLTGPGRIVIVLVEPRDPRNIGAVARAMSNLGVHELRLVAPAPFNREVAQGVACWGDSIIQNLGTFDSLEDAVADVHEVVGFASDSGHHRIPQMLLQHWVAQRREHAESHVALVFGSEENGLRREHFPLCQALIRIPSSGENRSYNLAQSVLLALFELRQAPQICVGNSCAELPTNAQLKPLVEMVLSVAEDVGFVRDYTPEHIREGLENMTRRGRFTSKELKLLTGLVGTLRKVLHARR
jgi:tRNA/rRNA methyltransferase